MNPHDTGTVFLAKTKLRAELQRVEAARPWWRARLVGYICVLPLVAAGASLMVLGEVFLPRFYFSSVFFLVAILLTSLCWGVGPGLLALALSCAALISFYLTPFSDRSLVSLDWELLFQILPFALAGLVVAVITSQRETARLRALQAMQLARDQAARLSDMNEELQQANRLKDFFLSVASHELKTPITTIRGQAQLALRRLDRHSPAFAGAEGLRDVFVCMQDQTGRVTDLINDLLDLSTLRSGRLSMECGLCNLNAICARAVEEQRLLSGRPIELLLPERTSWLQGDARRLGQVITNLLTNALKYSPGAGPVRVEIVYEQRVARLSVRDAGRGICAEQLASIFKPFYRTSEARASNANGTGLGLAICAHIVEQHRGRIWCESLVGSGSTFFVELPVSEGENLDASV
ncbi:MAG TPA: HAMP domain-containing sensor histidine kinase [Ktedonobacteraceae bacterium]|jgi:signal transduction histidine kinase